jgi:competence protein ComEA
MLDVPRSQLVAYALAALIVVLLGARYLRSDPAPTAGAGKPVPIGVATGPPPGREAGFAVVQVAGEVHRPGVYRVRAGQRVDDAVRLAGGPTGRADLAGVNLAAKVEDGRQVVVPGRGAVGTAAAVSGAAPGATAGSAGAAGRATGPPVNLNAATPEQLDQLDGIGPATAQKIVAYRQQHGGFRSVSELDRVPGIGAKRLAALRARVTV